MNKIIESKKKKKEVIFNFNPLLNKKIKKIELKNKKIFYEYERWRIT